MIYISLHAVDRREASTNAPKIKCIAATGALLMVFIVDGAGPLGSAGMSQRFKFRDNPSRL
jgi:hypothetical protein